MPETRIIIFFFKSSCKYAHAVTSVTLEITWEDKSPVSKPSSKATVHHEGNKDDWVDAEGDGEEAGREEDGVLDRVEARAREGGRVVALVVELVDVLVKESTLELRKGWIL